MFKDLFVNACILFSSLFVCTQLLSFHPVFPQTSKLRRMLHGIMFGFIGAVLTHFSIELKDGVMADLRYVPVALASIYGGWLSALLSATFVIAYTSAMFEPSLSVMITGLGAGIGSALLSRLPLKHWMSWVLHMLFILTVYIVLFSYHFSNWPSFTILLGSFTVILMLSGWLAAFYLEYHRRKKLLEVDHDRLTRFDSLTGLINFQQFYKELAALLSSSTPVCLILVDCQDLKSMNIQHGYQHVNRELQHIARLLRYAFDDAPIIARYGGDEFALVVRYKDKSTDLALIQNKLEIDVSQQAGVPLTYGISFYPEDASTQQELLSQAESELFSMKREIWLQREEHLFRAEKLKAVGELAAGMAHEIRNPLTAVKGFMQIAKESSGYNIAAYYEIIMNEISRMSELTAEFLQFSKPGATSFQPHAVQDCVQRAIQLTESEGIRRGYQIHYSDELLSPTLVRVDKDKIVQVLLNLIKNAFEAMEPGGHVLIKLYRGKANAILIEVRDKGTGIEPEMMNKLFQPFFTTKENGTGLGLSICHKVIQDHSGTITVQSEVGVGTSFLISLPCDTGKPV